MIKELIDTAVKVETEQEARLVVALYELTGINKHEGFDKHLPEAGIRWKCVAHGHFDIFMDENESKFKLITLDQLAWDYGLAPEWAVDLRKHGDEYYWADGGNMCHISNHNGYWEYYGDVGKVISTRPRKSQRMVGKCTTQIKTITKLYKELIQLRGRQQHERTIFERC